MLDREHDGLVDPWPAEVRDDDPERRECVDDGLEAERVRIGRASNARPAQPAVHHHRDVQLDAGRVHREGAPLVIDREALQSRV